MKCKATFVPEGDIVRILLAAAAAATLLAGCQVGGVIGEPVGRVNPERIAEQRIPLARVVEVEIGRTRAGFAVTAVGEADSGGWSMPALRPRGVTPEGVIEIDLLALPPDGPAAGSNRLLTMYDFSPYDIRGATGFRVIARDNEMTASLE